MQEFRLAICDDEPIHIEKICQYLAAYESESGNRLLIEQYLSGKDALRDMCTGKKEYDMLFLDVDMPDMAGTDVAVEVRKFNTEIAICFITSYENYAYQAFLTDATGYLLKPVEYKDFKRLADKCAVQIQYARDKKVAQEMYFQIRTERNETIVPLHDIWFIEKKRNKCVFHLADREITSYDTLSKVYEKLNTQQFYYTHQGYIVNFDCIKEVAPDKVYLAGDLEIPVSRKYYKDLRKLHIDKIKRLLSEQRTKQND